MRRQYYMRTHHSSTICLPHGRRRNFRGLRRPTEVGHLGFEALFATHHMQSQVTRLVDDALARAHGTNLTGFELLSRLERLPADGASVRFLSDHVLLSPSRVSRVVDEFVRRGVLERGVSPQDGRLCLVRLARRAGRSSPRCRRRSTPPSTYICCSA